MTYKEKLLDPRWQKKRLEILSRDNFTCQKCSDDKITLHIHHDFYNGDPWDIENENLITVCKDCHFVIEEFKKIKRVVLTCNKVQDEGFSTILEYYFKNSDGTYGIQIYYIDVFNKLILIAGIKELTLIHYISVLKTLK